MYISSFFSCRAKAFSEYEGLEKSQLAGLFDRHLGTDAAGSWEAENMAGGSGGTRGARGWLVTPEGLGSSGGWVTSFCGRMGQTWAMRWLIRRTASTGFDASSSLWCLAWTSSWISLLGISDQAGEKGCSSMGGLSFAAFWNQLCRQGPAVWVVPSRWPGSRGRGACRRGVAGSWVPGVGRTHPLTLRCFEHMLTPTLSVAPGLSALRAGAHLIVLMLDGRAPWQCPTKNPHHSSPR